LNPELPEYLPGISLSGAYAKQRRVSSEGQVKYETPEQTGGGVVVLCGEVECREMRRKEGTFKWMRGGAWGVRAGACGACGVVVGGRAGAGRSSQRRDKKVDAAPE